MSTKQFKFIRRKPALSKLNEKFPVASSPQSCFFFNFRREQNPVEKKKQGSKSKHVKKFSSKKPKGVVGNKKPKKGGMGRKRR